MMPFISRVKITAERVLMGSPVSTQRVSFVWSPFCRTSTTFLSSSVKSVKSSLSMPFLRACCIYCSACHPRLFIISPEEVTSIALLSRIRAFGPSLMGEVIDPGMAKSSRL